MACGLGRTEPGPTRGPAHQLVKGPLKARPARGLVSFLVENNKILVEKITKNI